MRVRQPEVEQDAVDAAEPVARLGEAGGHGEIDFGVGLGEQLADKKRVGFVIFDEEDAQTLANGHARARIGPSVRICPRRHDRHRRTPWERDLCTRARAMPTR
ncbi:hypothetical protein GCM10023170_007240 [Phytohabitans houttuyneae]